MKQVFSISFRSTFLLLFLSMFAFAQTQVTTYEQDFNNDVDTSFWANNWGGGLITGDRDGEAFKYETDSLNNYFLGVILEFANTKNSYLDLTENPFVSFMAKAELGAIINDVVVDSIPIGMDLINPQGANIGFVYLNSKIPVDGEYHECYFDFSDIASSAGMDSVTKVRFNPGKDRNDGWVYYKGSVTIDDFKAGEAAKAIDPPTILATYTEDYSDAVSTELWRPNAGLNTDGTPIFTLTQIDSTLKYDMVQNAFWDGQFYNFLKHDNTKFDLVENSYFTVDIKVDTGATYDGIATSTVRFLASPWGVSPVGVDGVDSLVRQVDSPFFDIPADGEWHTYTFDFGSKIGDAMWNGIIPPGDLSNIEAILLETSVWPSNYVATWHMDNFKMGEAAIPVVDPGEAIQFKKIPSLKDIFYTSWTVTPTHQPMDGATGIGKGEVGSFGDMGILVLFKDDQIKAYNGTGYDADSLINFEAGKEYTIKVTADMSAQTYSVDITPAGMLFPTRLATDYVFRSTNIQDTLNYFGMVINELELWGGVPGARLNPSFMEDTYELNFVENTAYEAQTEEFKVKFNIMPTAQKLNTAVTLQKDDAIMDGWGALSAIVRLNSSDQFDARNGTSYGSDVTLNYVAGTKYAVEMDVNVAAKTYSVAITPEGDTTTVIATDYGFRASVDTLTTFSQLTIIGGLWGGSIGEVMVSDFAIIKESDPIQTKDIPTLSEQFFANWKVTPTHSPMDGAVGLGKGEVGTFGDMGILVLFNSSSKITAYNGTGYEAVNDLAYEAGTEYAIEIIGDIETQTYSVNVTPAGGVKTVIGTDYVFRGTNVQDSLSYFGMVINELELWGGVPGARLNPSFMDDEYELIFVSNDAYTPQVGTCSATFDIVPTAQRLNAGVALLKGEAPVNGWGAMSAILQLNGENKFAARDGATYKSDENLEYVAGTKYSVIMNVDVPSQTYSVTITPDGGSEIALATDYAFRAAADTLDNLAQMTVIGGLWGGSIGEVIVSNFNITTTAIGSEEGLPKSYALAQNYPNPFNPSTTINYELPKASNVSITIYNALGQKVAELLNSEMKAGRYQMNFNASNLSSGLYFYSIKAGEFSSTKKMMLLK